MFSFKATTLSNGTQLSDFGLVVCNIEHAKGCLMMGGYTPAPAVDGATVYGYWLDAEPNSSLSNANTDTTFLGVDALTTHSEDNESTVYGEIRIADVIESVADGEIEVSHY